MKIKKIGTALIASAFIGRIILQPVTALAANPGDYANCDGFSRDDIYNMLNNAGYTDWYDPILGTLGLGVTVATFFTGVGELQAGARAVPAAIKAGVKSAKPLITGTGKGVKISAKTLTSNTGKKSLGELGTKYSAAQLDEAAVKTAIDAGKTINIPVYVGNGMNAEATAASKIIQDLLGETDDYAIALAKSLKAGKTVEVVIPGTVAGKTKQILVATKDAAANVPATIKKAGSSTKTAIKDMTLDDWDKAILAGAVVTTTANALNSSIDGLAFLLTPSEWIGAINNQGAESNACLAYALDKEEYGAQCMSQTAGTGTNRDHNCVYRKIAPLDTTGPSYTNAGIKTYAGYAAPQIKPYSFVKKEGGSDTIYMEDLGLTLFGVSAEEFSCRVALFGGVCNGNEDRTSSNGTSPYISGPDGILGLCNTSAFDSCVDKLAKWGINVSKFRFADDKPVKYFVLEDCSCSLKDAESQADVPAGENIYKAAQDSSTAIEDAKKICLAALEELKKPGGVCPAEPAEEEVPDETPEHIEGARTTDNEATTFDQETYALTMAVNYMSEDILKNQNEIEKELEKLQKTMGEEGYAGFLLPMWEKIKSNFAYSSDSF